METIREESFEYDNQSPQKVPNLASHSQDTCDDQPNPFLYKLDETPQSRKAPIKRVIKRPPRFDCLPVPPKRTQNPPPPKTSTHIQNPQLCLQTQNTQNTQQEKLQTAQLEIVDKIGEGAFGEVLLVKDMLDPMILLAVKCINLNALNPELVKIVRREALLQRLVSNHENVIRYVSMRINTDEVFQIFLEYAGGGELFDQIEPDVGLEPKRAQMYFRQLIKGLEHIHSFGVVHRDIKPENLLLDKTHQVLKIADFGMATIFKHGGTERALDTQCGTAPYAAPEVFAGLYKAEPIDIWSAGVVLVAMLSGELPWEKPTRECEEYVSFVDRRDMKVRPWSRIATEEISILRIMLNTNPKHRANIARIKMHPFFTRNYDDAFHDIISPHGAKRRRVEIEERASPIATNSQPPVMKFMRTDENNQKVTPLNKKISRGGLSDTSFTQPPNFESLLIAKSQVTDGSQSQSSHPLQIAYRLTRFFVTVDLEKAIEVISEACERTQHESTMKYPNQLFVQSLVSTEGPSFVVSFFKMLDNKEHLVLIDFRRSKGDGLEFKRRFLRIKKMLHKIIYKNSVDLCTTMSSLSLIK